MRFDLPDRTCSPSTPRRSRRRPSSAHVGTTLFNMAVNPVSGAVYVSNTDSRNEVRFEGPGVFGGSTVQGHLAESRITVLDRRRRLPAPPEQAHRLRRSCPRPAGVKDHSLATPVGMAVSPDGATLYVAAFGSSTHRRLRHRRARGRHVRPDRGQRRLHRVSGGGPSGLVLDAARERLYVLTRFDDAVSVVDLGTQRRDRASRAAQPGAGQRRRRAAVPLRRRRRPRATARRRARAATSSATWTTSPGISATPTTR